MVAALPSELPRGVQDVDPDDPHEREASQVDNDAIYLMLQALHRRTEAISVGCIELTTRRDDRYSRWRSRRPDVEDASLTPFPALHDRKHPLPLPLNVL